MRLVGPANVELGSIGLGYVGLALNLLRGLLYIRGRLGKVNSIIGAIFIEGCGGPDRNAAGRAIYRMARAVILAVNRWPPDMLVCATSDLVSLEHV